jgi:hypothetical protein
MTDKPEEPYRTGPGRPPKKNMFKPGVSGNPRGRPKKKKDKSFLEAMAEELYEPVRVMEGQRALTITRLEAMAKQVLVKAISGDKKCLDVVLRAEAAIAAERAQRDGPQASGVLMVPATGCPSLIAQALGMTLLEEVELQQRPYRDGSFATREKAMQEIEQIKKELEEKRRKEAGEK